MPSAALPRPLRGIVPPLVTPLSGPDELDHAGLTRLVEHVIAGGVAGVFVLGTTGEGPSISYRLRRELIDQVCRQVRGRVPVLVGITDTSMTEAVALAGIAADCGAAAAVAAPPYYFTTSQPELLHFVRLLAAQVPLPLFLYNMPEHTKVSFRLEVVRQALDVDNVAGFKDSGGDLEFFRQVRQLTAARPEWTHLIGPEHLTAESVLSGGHGGVNGGANLHPRLFVDLYEAAARGDTDRVSELQRQVVSLGRIYRVSPTATAVIKGLKCALHARGLCPERMAEPFDALAPSEREEVRRIVGELRLDW